MDWFDQQLVCFETFAGNVVRGADQHLIDICQVKVFPQLAVQRESFITGQSAVQKDDVRAPGDERIATVSNTAMDVKVKLARKKYFVLSNEGLVIADQKGK